VSGKGRALLPGAGVVAAEAAFRTSTFLVRYCEEEISLNEIAQFRIERESSDSSPLTLELRLMFADVAKHGGLERFVDSKNRVVEDNLQFEEVSTLTLRLHGPLQGLHAFCPAVFDEFHFCQVDLMAHSSLVDFRLRSSRPASAKVPDVASKNGHSGTNGSDSCLSKRPGGCVWSDGEPEPLEAPSFGSCAMRRSDFDACGSRTVGACIDRGNGIPADDGCGHASPLEAAILSLARSLRPSGESGGLMSNRWNGPVHSEHSEDSCRGQRLALLGEAADLVQREYVGRLAEAHAALSEQLAKLAPAQPAGTKPPSGAKPPALKLPACSEESGGTPADLSARIITAAGRAGQAHASAGAAAAKLLSEDLSFVSAQVFEVWQLLLATLRRFPALALMHLRAAWDKQLRLHWSESVFSTVLPTGTIMTPEDQKVWETHSRIATALRRSTMYRKLVPHVVQDLSMSVPASTHTVFFDQRYADTYSTEADEAGGIDSLEKMKGYVRKVPPPALGAPKPAEEPPPSNDADAVAARPSVAPRGAYRGAHVFVLVHGFQGQAFDMRLVKNNISLLFPRAMYLCSTANEKDTEADIDEMGNNLAKEVKAFVKDWCPGEKGPRLGRLSFVCHSNGGLVARSALPRLIEEFGDKFYTFLTFSSPHLGYLYPSNSLFKTGLWLVRKVRASACLDQLSLRDAADPKESFLSRLAQAPGLEHFQNVVLVSSFQDQYAPFESARMEMSRCVETDTAFGDVYRDMVKNLVEKIKPERLLRVDIDFFMPETNLDTMIGRAAHIQFIECQPLQRMFVHSYRWLFE